MDLLSLKYTQTAEGSWEGGNSSRVGRAREKRQPARKRNCRNCTRLAFPYAGVRGCSAH